MSVRTILPLLAILGLPLLAVPAACHTPAGHQEEAHHQENDESMKAQHERMVNFKTAADMLSNAIIFSSMKLADEGADLLEKSQKGREKDVPHKNLSRKKDFQALYAELGKRTKKLRETIGKNDLPASAAAYGRVLETCAGCHVKFRD